MTDYKELTVWKKSIDLVEKVYTLTRGFPKEETFGLSSQMRRAAVSISSNIAEGSRRKAGDRVHFLRISFGSASELETQLVITSRLKYGTNKEIDELLTEILRMLNKMIY